MNGEIDLGTCPERSSGHALRIYLDGTIDCFCCKAEWKGFIINYAMPQAMEMAARAHERGVVRGRLEGAARKEVADGTRTE